MRFPFLITLGMGALTFAAPIASEQKHDGERHSHAQTWKAGGGLSYEARSKRFTAEVFDTSPIYQRTIWPHADATSAGRPLSAAEIKQEPSDDLDASIREHEGRQRAGRPPRREPIKKEGRVAEDRVVAEPLGAPSPPSLVKRGWHAKSAKMLDPKTNEIITSAEFERRYPGTFGGNFNQMRVDLARPETVKTDRSTSQRSGEEVVDPNKGKRPVMVFGKVFGYVP